VEASLPPRLAHAGGARAAAMEVAADLVDNDNAILLTTDADAKPEPDWLAANVTALEAHAQAVAGVIIPDTAEIAQLPASLLQREQREARYAALLDEIAARVDPVPHDPWPRHDTHSGASIAVRHDVFRKVGGMPAIPLGEDRGFFDALSRVDARVRHSPAARVVVSCRLEGRAIGGMADTLSRRMSAPHEPLDERLEPAEAALRRVLAKRSLRGLWHHPDAHAARFAALYGLDTASMFRVLDQPYFGLAWEHLQQASPSLARQRVPAARLMSETETARSLLRELRQRDAIRLADGAAMYQADTSRGLPCL
jgi:hypothetical protein